MHAKAIQKYHRKISNCSRGFNSNVKNNFPVPNAKSPLAASIGGFAWKIESPRGYQSQLPVAITQPFMSNAHIKIYMPYESFRESIKKIRHA